MRSEFTVFRRKGSKFWYYYVVQDGRRVAKSTCKTNRYDAATEARMALKKTVEPVTFEEFTRDFFVWDKCPWIAAQHAAGRSFSQGAAASRHSHVTTWHDLDRLSIRESKDGLARRTVRRDLLLTHLARREGWKTWRCYSPRTERNSSRSGVTRSSPRSFWSWQLRASEAGRCGR
ncbi:MAG: hypothetical protein NTU62_10460 [Spirochaetes bacterium]|nr:hypothetical protein [Spirochaetota bacterium]